MIESIGRSSFPGTGKVDTVVPVGSKMLFQTIFEELEEMDAK